MPPKTTMKPSQILAQLEQYGAVKPRLYQPHIKPKDSLPKVLTVATVSFTRKELEARPELTERVMKAEAFCDALDKLASRKSGYKFSKREFFLNAVLEVIDRINAQTPEENNG